MFLPLAMESLFYLLDYKFVEIEDIFISIFKNVENEF